MTLYMVLNILIVLFPVLLSFDQKVYYFGKWPLVLLSLLPVSAAYIAWDHYATEKKHWGFNDRFVSSLRPLSIPVEEWLFFLTVPFSCLFILECVLAYFPAVPLGFSPFFSLTALLFFIPAYIFRKKAYTFLAFLTAGMITAILPLAAPGLGWDARHLVSLAVCFVPFGLFNGILTAKPVVTYNPEAVTNVRVGSIPIEDFFYNMAMIGFYFLSYTGLKRLAGG